MNVIQVAPKETHHWLMTVHYAKRIPSITYAFGLFESGVPLGYVTYGTPSSAPLREGVAGPENAGHVLELNRLVFPEPVKNGPSFLVASSLRNLPKPSIIVSYADTATGHVGYVYQACNFLYTGMSAKRTDWRVRGMDGLHGQSIADMSRSAAGGERGSRAKFMRDKFGDDFYLEDRARKHRYIYIVGSKAQRKSIRAALSYPIQKFPKGDSDRYRIDEAPVCQPQIFPE